MTKDYKVLDLDAYKQMIDEMESRYTTEEKISAEGYMGLTHETKEFLAKEVHPLLQLGKKDLVLDILLYLVKTAADGPIKKTMAAQQEVIHLVIVDIQTLISFSSADDKVKQTEAIKAFGEANADNEEITLFVQQAVKLY